MRGPLEGIRVFDLTLILVGPWSTMNLGALGADVIHIERPGIERGSLGGGIPPYINGTSIGHITWNMNKRQMFLDLKSEFDIDLAHQLLATCDVFVDNMRPGVADRLTRDSARPRPSTPPTRSLHLHRYPPPARPERLERRLSRHPWSPRGPVSARRCRV